MRRIDRLLARLAGGVERVTASALGPYQSAVVRIGFAATWLLFLLREFPHRHRLYGPDGPWSWHLAQQLIADNGSFTALMWSDSGGWFEIVYVLSMLSSLLLMLGWRTRTMSVLFMIGVLSLQNRSVFVGDGGDNVIHLMAIYLVLTRCGQVWSLDARRAARARGGAARPAEAGLAVVARPAEGGTAEVAGSAEAGSAEAAEGPRATSAAPVDRVGPVLWWLCGLALSVVTFMGELSSGWSLVFWGLWLVHAAWWALGRYAPGSEPRALFRIVTNLVHNAALLVIMAEACLIYATAGWYKIQGGRWQDGTAVHYPLHLDYFSPWPALGELLVSSAVLLTLVTYGTVIVQVAFPFTLFNRRVKNVLLAFMIVEHAVIAVVLGLPFFSLAMIAADAVFLPTSFLRRAGRGAARCRAAVLSAGRWPARRVDGVREDGKDRRGERGSEAAEGNGDGGGTEDHARVGFTP
ncbi:Vitamin K-dependent gamma-carboxylase [Streptomyces sp. YIM 130001]|uniref:HTTM domain-containing protein n=1 Tax=Streptomyces sp. YIM 130001 TaxID=2259644 RepID=UPI000E65284E|nr:HTTM domain-containing protein [Streptomyces sp. YIM 130001]RII11271.1 Vitamin K-dependent gamma-carboxylase [Streptomyces sp. YIM 130001]